MKPFNLEKALAGEPVLLKNGRKAYIKYKIESSIETCPYVGHMIGDNNEVVELTRWNEVGGSDECSLNTIIGMWQEPRPQVTITIPAPLSFASASEYDKVWMLDGTNMLKWKYPSKQNLQEAIDSGALLFASYLDGEAFLQAMREARL